MTEEQTEGRIQEECFIWAHNFRPHTRQLLCYNLNNSKNKIDGNLNKGKGLIKGRSDFTLYWLGKAYFIEMKTPTGTQSPDQIIFQRVVESHGFQYFICRSLNEFIQIIDTIICEKK